MKKSDLKTGMRVRMRCGAMYLVIKDIHHVDGHQELAFINETGFMKGSNYNDELINTFGFTDDFDVMEVYQINEKPKSLLQCDTLNLDNKYLIWERQEFTDEQKEIFKALKVLGFNYIARDGIDDTLIAYDEKPTKKGGYWIAGTDGSICDIDRGLDFIEWEDEKPFEIPNIQD